MTYKKLIDQTHPMALDKGPELDRAFDADTLAMKLVGERHGKRDLVDLVRWLIMKRPELLPNVDVSREA